MAVTPIDHTTILDGVNVGVLAAVFANVLPSIATLITVLYFGTRIIDWWEARRGQKAKPPWSDDDPV